ALPGRRGRPARHERGRGRAAGRCRPVDCAPLARGGEVGGSPRSRGAVAGGDQSVRASPGPHGLAVLAVRVDVAGFEPACREGPRAAFPTIDTMSRPKAHLGPAREGGGRASTSEAEATSRGLHDTHDDLTVSDKLV